MFVFHIHHNPRKEFYILNKCLKGGYFNALCMTLQRSYHYSGGYMYHCSFRSNTLYNHRSRYSYRQRLLDNLRRRNCCNSGYTLHYIRHHSLIDIQYIRHNKIGNKYLYIPWARFLRL